MATGAAHPNNKNAVIPTTQSNNFAGTGASPYSWLSGQFLGNAVCLLESDHVPGDLSRTTLLLGGDCYWSPVTGVLGQWMESKTRVLQLIHNARRSDVSCGGVKASHALSIFARVEQALSLGL